MAQTHTHRERQSAARMDVETIDLVYIFIYAIDMNQKTFQTVIHAHAHINAKLGRFIMIVVVALLRLYFSRCATLVAHHILHRLRCRWLEFAFHPANCTDGWLALILSFDCPQFEDFHFPFIFFHASCTAEKYAICVRIAHTRNDPRGSVCIARQAKT